MGALLGLLPDLIGGIAGMVGKKKDDSPQQTVSNNNSSSSSNNGFTVADMKKMATDMGMDPSAVNNYLKNKGGKIGKLSLNT